MAFLIADPKLSPVRRFRLWRSARSDARNGGPKIDDAGFFHTNSVSEMAAKTHASIARETAKFTGCRWKDLKALYGDYEAVLAKLQQAYADYEHALQEAEGLRLPGDEELSEEGLRERIGARAIRHHHSYKPVIESYKESLESMAEAACKQYDLAGYEAARLDFGQHCVAAICYHYEWPAQIYSKYLCRALGLADELKVPPFEDNWASDLNTVLPELDFNKHVGA